MAQGFKMRKLVDEYKNIFVGKQGKRWNSSKTFFLYLSFLYIGFEVGDGSKFIVIIVFSNALNV